MLQELAQPAVIVFLFAFAAAGIALAAFVYVILRFLIVIVTLDAAISRSHAVASGLKEMVAKQPAPNTKEGYAEPYDEKALYLAEKIRKERQTQPDLSDDRLNELIEHGIGGSV